MFPFSAHSPETSAMASLFRGVFLLSAAIFALVAFLVIFGVIRFRSRGEGNPPQIEGSQMLETFWTAAPLITVLILFVVTVRTMRVVDVPAEIRGDPDLVIIGHQWWWEGRYPNGA